jgi:hypothetical protein
MADRPPAHRNTAVRLPVHRNMADRPPDRRSTAVRHPARQWQDVLLSRRAREWHGPALAAALFL